VNRVMVMETGQLRERKGRRYGADILAIQTTPGYKVYKTLELDTLKLYTLAHGHKVCCQQHLDILL